MGQFWKIFILLLPISISAQIYAPDTTFRFSASTFKLPAYKFTGITASNENFTLAQIQPAYRDANYQTYSNTALLDANGQIITSITDGQIIPNSLTGNGFWVNTTQYLSETDSVFHFYYFDIASQKKILHQLKLKYPVRSIVSIENACAIFQNIENDTNTLLYYIYDLEKGLISVINPDQISTKRFSSERFYIQELKIDEEKNTWVLVNKNLTDTSATLQLYKVKPNESLSKANLIFEKTDKELGTYNNTIWQNASFFENYIVFKRNINFVKPRELIKIDLQGNILPAISILPLVNNDPNTFYDFIKTANSTYICFRVGQSEYYFLDKAGKLSNYKIPTDKYNNVIIENDKLIYVDNASEIHVIDIPKLKELNDYKPVPVIDYQPAISYIQALNNDDYWLGYQNPYQDSKFFAKYSQNKEVFRLEDNSVKIYHLSKNNVLIQDINGKIRKFDAANTETILPINDNNIVYVDTLHSHIYTNSNGGELKRYFYDGKQDLSFKWTGGRIKTDIIVDDNGKIHSLGKRFLSNGSIDPDFLDTGIELVTNYYSATVFTLNKIGENILMFNGACSMGCVGNFYFWSKNENSAKKINTNFWKYPIQFQQLVQRDSLILLGYTKIFPNLQVDTNFKINGTKSSPIYPFQTSTPKTIDILPNHDLLIASGKELLRYSTKNNLWVEIRNLKGEISLNDSLLKSGIDLDVFSSDNSTVQLKIENVSNITKIAYLEGNKLLFTGKEGVIKLTAKSVKGGTPFEIQFPINDWRLQNSTIKITPSDTTLYVGFKPFPITIKADSNLPLLIKTEGSGAYLKDGIVYPTGKSGFININVSHEAMNGFRAYNQTFTVWIHPLQQKISYIGTDSLTNTYYLPESAFPFKIPIQTSSKLPIRYTLNNWNLNLAQIFHLSNDSIYLNPNYKELRQKFQTDYSPIGFVVNGYQSGNNAFQSAFFSVNIQLLLPQEKPLLAPLEVFPNPFDSYINIYCPNKEIITEAIIYDFTGKLIRKYSVTSNDYWSFQFPFYSPQMQVVKLFTDDIPKGKYLLVFTANNQKITKRIIK
ncbi:hypothetical protein GCM10027035_48770 [Emticicia sediminis]